eukprot:4584823-Pleurochrysis_carterae.AAC.2
MDKFACARMQGTHARVGARSRVPLRAVACRRVLPRALAPARVPDDEVARLWPELEELWVLQQPVLLQIDEDGVGRDARVAVRALEVDRRAMVCTRTATAARVFGACGAKAYVRPPRAKD